MRLSEIDDEAPDASDFLGLDRDVEIRERREGSKSLSLRHPASPLRHDQRVCDFERPKPRRQGAALNNGVERGFSGCVGFCGNEPAYRHRGVEHANRHVSGDLRRAIP